MGIENIIRKLGKTVTGQKDFHSATLGQSGFFVSGSSDPFYSNINPTGDNKIQGDVGTIANVSGDTWRITFDSAKDLSRVSKACQVVISNADDDENNGTYMITDVNDGSDYIEVTNADGVAQASAGGQILISPPMETCAVMFMGSTITFTSDPVFKDQDGATFPSSSVQDGQIFYGNLESLVLSAGNAIVYYI